MKLYFLLILAQLLVGTIAAINTTVLFREIAAKGDTTQTLKLILKEKPDYPVAFVKVPEKGRWLIQLYKDGGDSIISPLDNEGNPTGDDILINHPSHLQSSQGLHFTISHFWTMNGINFFPPGKNQDAWQGDKVYLRIFNNSSIEEADKYIVSHTLFTTPNSNEVVAYVPDYGWDARGWISFRIQKEK